MNSGDVICAIPGTGVDTCIIGNTATGSQTVDGVATSHAITQVGETSTGNGSLTVQNGGSVSIASGGYFSFGRQGSGTGLVSSGGSISTPNLELAEAASSSGQLTVTGAGSTVTSTGPIRVGRSGIGNLTLQSGAVGSANTLSVGEFAGSSGSLTINNATLNVTEFATFGVFAGSSGTVLVSGADATMNVGTILEIGRNGDATMTIKDGASVENNGGTRVAFNAPGGSSTASLTVSNGATLTLSNVNPATATLAIGTVAGSNGTALVTGAGSTITSTSTLNVGTQGTGTLTVQNGGQVFATEGRFGTIAPTGNATVTVDGATSLLDAGSLIRMSVPPSLDPTAAHGTSLLTLKNDATVRATNIYVGESGTIKGNGTLDGNVTLLGGTLAPGLSPGQITITGDLTLNGGKLVIEIAGLGPGQFDVVDVGGTANLLAGTIEFDFINGFAPQTGDQIDFLSAASVILGDDLNFVYQGLAPGFEFAVDPTTGGLVFTALNNGVSVPEPSALAILAASLAGFWLVRAGRSRRRSVTVISS